MGVHTSGPVPIDSDLYIERGFEQEVRKSVLKKDWVVLLGPRQHGKTSALIRIKPSVKEAGFHAAFIDLQRQPPCETYEEFLEWFGQSIWRQIGEKKRPQTPPRLLRPSTWVQTGAQAELQSPAYKGELVDWLNAAITPGTTPIAIFIDEAATIFHDEWRNSFYGQIRALSNERATAEAGDVASRITFVFSGTFRVESLVETANSPFNVCKEIQTENLSFDKVGELCQRALGRDDDSVVRKIWGCVGGQPYLVQLLVSEVVAVPEDEAEEELTRAIRRLDEGTPHVASILSKVIEDHKLADIVSDVIENRGVKLAPADYDMKFLLVLGLLVRDGDKLVFANQYYERMASASPQLTNKASSEKQPRTILYELPEGSFSVIHREELREIVYRAHKGAVSAYNGGSYRLALIGYGVALEGLLIDWISNTATSALNTAISTANPTFLKKYEDRNDPETWKFVNLVKVARELADQHLTSASDIPDVIRDWRNCVHPKVMLENYEPEGDMETYAFTAEGLFRSALQRIGK